MNWKSAGYLVSSKSCDIINTKIKTCNVGMLFEYEKLREMQKPYELNSRTSYIWCVWSQLQGIAPIKSNAITNYENVLVKNVSSRCRVPLRKFQFSSVGFDFVSRENIW